MKRSILNPLFIVASVIFLLHQAAQKILGWHLPFTSSYLDNFLAMPIILTLWQAERQFLFLKDPAYTLQLPQVLVATVYIAFISEVVFPYFTDRFTQDWVDVIFFLAGSIIFYLFNRHYYRNFQVKRKTGN
jgi:hypothetical protein